MIRENPVAEQDFSLTPEQIELAVGMLLQEIQIQKFAVENHLASEDLKALFKAQSSGDEAGVHRVRMKTAADGLMETAVTTFWKTLQHIWSECVYFGVDLASDDPLYFFCIHEGDFETRKTIYRAELEANKLVPPTSLFRAIVVEEDDEIIPPSNFSDLTAFMIELWTPKQLKSHA